MHGDEQREEERHVNWGACGVTRDVGERTRQVVREDGAAVTSWTKGAVLTILTCAFTY
jgi:hypothetical protein